jgi:hypothetical protein
MRTPNRFWFIALVLTGALGAVLISQVVADEYSATDAPPSKVEPIEGTELSRVILSEKAAQRLAVATTPVAEDTLDDGTRKIIPYAAVIYSPNGDTWTYTSPEPHVFVREAIEVERIDGDRAILTDGPPPGTEVVTVGAVELLGAELGLGH